jgi:hypothetical protein
MDKVNNYLNLLFNDAAFTTILAIIAIIYAYYLSRKSPKSDRMQLITMSNHEQKHPRETTIVLLNRGHADMVAADILPSHPLLISFDRKLEISDFQVEFISSRSANFSLIRMSDHVFRINVDIIKRQQGVVLKVTHDSKKHMDLVCTEIQLEGIIKNFEIYRDDYSDQLVGRMTFVEKPVYIMTFFVGLFLSFSIKTLLKPVNIVVSPVYTVIICYALAFMPVFNFIAEGLGHNEYRAFWKLIKESRKHNKS